MDSRLDERLSKIDEHINGLHSIEAAYLQLEASKKGMQAALTIEAQGKSHAEKESHALASEDWKKFSNGLAQQEASYNREKRRYELLLKAFDAEYLTMKIESSVIKRQL